MALGEETHAHKSLNPREEQTAANDIAAALTQQQKGVPFLPIWVSSKWSPEGQEECGRTSSEAIKFSLGQAKPLAASQPPQGVTEAPLLPGSIPQKVALPPKSGKINPSSH